MASNPSKRTRSRRLAVGCAGIAMVAGMLFGAMPAMAQPKGEIVVAGALLRQQFDPTIMIAVTDYTAYDLLYDGLLDLGATGKYPALATSWTISDDGRQIEFQLRKNVRFHNGDPFSAEDVKFTYETIIKEGNTHSYRKPFADSIDRIEIIDPHMVRFVLRQPWPGFFSSARYGLQPIIPKTYYEKVGARGFLEKPVGTGPFKLVGMKAGEWSRFEANAEYWGQVPKIKYVTQKMVKEPFTLYAMIEKGEADIAFGMSGALLDKVKSSGRMRIFESKYSGTSAMYFNKEKFPEAADKRVRLAIAYALNRAEIAKRILGGVCEPATSIFTPATFGHLPGLVSIPYDPAKSKQLLAEAGIKPGKEIGFTLHTESFGSLPSAPQVLEALAGNLEEVGFKVTREAVDTSSWLAMMRAKKQPAVFYGPSSMPDDGGETLDGWFTSRALWSSGNIKVPEYDEIAKAQLQAVDLRKREQMLQHFAKLEDGYREAVPLFWCSTTFVAGPRVKQWSPAVSSAYNYNFQTMELAD